MNRFGFGLVLGGFVLAVATVGTFIILPRVAGPARGRAMALPDVREPTEDSFLLLSGSLSLSEHNRVLFFYRVPASRFFAIPTWYDQNGPPPLSVDKAVAIARAGLNPPDPQAKIQTIQLQQKQNRWYYTINFENRPSSHPDEWYAVVPMDGAIVTPTFTPAETPAPRK